jgi:hypothetical protein
LRDSFFVPVISSVKNFERVIQINYSDYITHTGIPFYNGVVGQKITKDEEELMKHPSTRWTGHPVTVSKVVNTK